MTLSREIAACDPFACSPADFRRLYLKARAMRDRATKLSERATAMMYMSKVKELAEERACGHIDLSDSRASERIAARAR